MDILSVQITWFSVFFVTLNFLDVGSLSFLYTPGLYFGNDVVNCINTFGFLIFFL
jgi:hypothetical protein